MQAEILPQYSCQSFKFYYLCNILLATEIPPNQFFYSLLLIPASRMSFEGNAHSSFSAFNVASLSGNINLSSDILNFWYQE